ncbi:homoserine dehydrogenase [compost metagenome]
MRKHAGGYFIRLTVLDRIGAFAAIAKRMAENDISLESIVQRPPMDGAANEGIKTVILVTHETTEAAVKKALEAILKDDHLVDKPQMIRIERAG